MSYDVYNALATDHIRLRDKLTSTNVDFAQLQAEQLETARQVQRKQQALARERMDVVASRAKAASINASFEDACRRYQSLQRRFETTSAELMLAREENKRLAGEVARMKERAAAGLEVVS